MAAISEKRYTALAQHDGESQITEELSRVDLDWRKDVGLVQETR
jgi:hypothetical protein